MPDRPHLERRLHRGTGTREIGHASENTFAASRSQHVSPSCATFAEQGGQLGGLGAAAGALPQQLRAERGAGRYGGGRGVHPGERRAVQPGAGAAALPHGNAGAVLREGAERAGGAGGRPAGRGMGSPEEQVAGAGAAAGGGHHILLDAGGELLPGRRHGGGDAAHAAPRRGGAAGGGGVPAAAAERRAADVWEARDVQAGRGALLGVRQGAGEDGIGG
mmetsp:Transcript_38381/g.98123  ORF Transcript_38381/g.98123 Transcript_38381/m.98123 type:complete len:219 (+) Transcript_38381:273-929(+)